MKPVKDLNIVIGLCERKGQFLLLQRRDENPLWDRKWEFPGGKIEAGEEPEIAIVREVQEETGLPILASRFFRLHDHDWNLEEKVLRVHIHCFHCLVGEGEAQHEQDKAYQAQWFSKEEALALDSLEANGDILKAFLHETASHVG
ncbi:NUDIX domain-containing protein [Candidatus Uhrbacteria bacterium]|nr:NUDIX domain-containing protein [Candidatus Uhrbacteria bacterium]